MDTHGSRLRFVLFALAGLAGAACPAPSADDCTIGTENCACTPGGSCDPGLTCASDVCVDLGGGSSDGSASAGGSDPTSASASEASASDASASEASAESGTDPETGTGGSSSGGVDECTANGGTPNASGFCFKPCAYDDSGTVPGNDLFGDCQPLGMVCRSSYYSDDYCWPPGWQDECESDADCEAGGVCVTRTDLDGTVTSRYCYANCSIDGDCGMLHCVQDCPSGLTSPLGYCDDVLPPYGTICCESWPDPC